jgi:hypothetical protein
MKLWLIKLLPTTWSGYDCAEGFVVAADSEEEARALAATRKGDEGAFCWESPSYSEATLIAPSSIYTSAQIVLRDYLAG